MLTPAVGAYSKTYTLDGLELTLSTTETWPGRWHILSVSPNAWAISPEFWPTEEEAWSHHRALWLRAIGVIRANEGTN